MLYHIKFMERTDSGECTINLTKEELIDRYVNPYLSGDTIIINGTTIDPHKIWKVKVTSSEEPLDKIIEKLKQEYENSTSPFIALMNLDPAWEAIDKVKDVTNQFFNKAPKSRSIIKKGIKEKDENGKGLDKIFVVHGHDTELKNDVEIFLRSINLKPIVLHRQLDEGLTIIEKFEKHSDVKYAIILLTPDDFGYSIEEEKKNEKNRAIELRARQNVIFEFGYFVGKLSRRNVCCIFKEGVSLPSDLNGLIYKKVNKSVEEVGLFLMKELKNIGLRVRFE